MRISAAHKGKMKRHKVSRRIGKSLARPLQAGQGDLLASAWLRRQCAAACRGTSLRESGSEQIPVQDPASPRGSNSRDLPDHRRSAVGLRAELQPCAPGNFHLGKQSQPPPGLVRFHTPEIQRASREGSLGIGPAAPHPHAAHHQIDQAANSPQHVAEIPAGPASDPANRRECLAGSPALGWSVRWSEDRAPVAERQGPEPARGRRTSGSPRCCVILVGQGSLDRRVIPMGSNVEQLPAPLDSAPRSDCGRSR